MCAGPGATSRRNRDSVLPALRGGLGGISQAVLARLRRETDRDRWGRRARVR